MLTELMDYIVLVSTDEVFLILDALGRQHIGGYFVDDFSLVKE